jgi:hypothetical protein
MEVGQDPNWGCSAKEKRKWYYNKAQDTNNTHHKITHHAQIKHSKQNYANNKGHTTHNESSSDMTRINITVSLRMNNVMAVQAAKSEVICWYIILEVYVRIQ